MENNKELDLKIELLRISSSLKLLSDTKQAGVHNDVLSSVENILKERNVKYSLDRTGRAYTQVTITFE